MTDYMPPGTDINAPELDALAGEFDASPSDTDSGSEASAVQLSNSQMCAFVLEMAATAAATHYPSVRETASAERIQPVAGALGAVMDKYGFHASGWFERYAVEINALAAVGVFGMSVYAGIRADIDKAAERQQQAAKAERADDGRQQ